MLDREGHLTQVSIFLACAVPCQCYVVPHLLFAITYFPTRFGRNESVPAKPLDSLSFALPAMNFKLLQIIIHLRPAKASTTKSLDDRRSFNNM